MLSRLHITNYALIRDLDLELGKGLNIITGETGAGKSIILGALTLLMGGRADKAAVGDKKAKSVVEGTFSPCDADAGALKKIFAENDLDWDDEALTLRRELTATRSRAFVNDTPVGLDVLAKVSARLVDIHSQQANQLLAQPSYQLEVLDAMAGNGETAARYAAAYAEYRESRAKLDRARREAEASRADAEYARARFEQIDALRLRPGEQAALEAERRLLANAADIRQGLADIRGYIEDDRTGALVSLKMAAQLSRRLGEMLGEMKPLAERLENAAAEAGDILETLTRLEDGADFDPRRLEGVGGRLDEIYELVRRNRVADGDELVRLRDTLAGRLRLAEDGAGIVADLHARAQEAHRAALGIAREISLARRSAAGEFGRRLAALARPLGMANLVCDIRLETLKQLSPTGADAADMLFAFNKSQTPMPVGATASGGETSRLMLCVKTLMAGRMGMPTIIFDEIDTGLGGETASRVGRMMRDIARDIQVVAITHLPQVAARGDTHFKVYKEDTETATVTRLARLTDEERVGELAAMLSGDASEPNARATARAMLEQP